jgi:hypothetical protein
MINNRLTRSGLTSSAEVLRDLGLNVGNDPAGGGAGFGSPIPYAGWSGRDCAPRAGPRPRRTQSSTPLSVGRGGLAPGPCPRCDR